MRLNHSEKNAFKTLTYVIQKNKISVTKSSIKKDLYLHPDFPSLLSFSDVLKNYQVPNIAARISKEELNEIRLPAIAYLNIDGGYFAPIREVTANEVEWLDTNKGWQKESLDLFEEKWSNIVLLLEPNEKSGESNYKKKLKYSIFKDIEGYYITFGLMISSLLLMLIYGKQVFRIEWQFYLMLSLKFVGIITSILLLLNTLGTNNSILRSVCGLDSNTNCNNILKSEASKLWGWISWTDIGLIYFFGGFIILVNVMTNAREKDLIQQLWSLTILALPYTIWSVWYQWKIAKTWCRLCLTVQVLIWLEFLTGLYWNLQMNIVPSVEKLPIIILAFLLPSILLTFLKKLFQESEKVWPLKRELHKAKFNPEYVESIFGKQIQMPPIFEGMYVIKMGNPIADNTLTIVTNPICHPCRKLHPELEALIESTENLNCQFVFIFNSQAIEITETILSLPNECALNAMHLWYTINYRSTKDWKSDIKTEKVVSDSKNQIDIHSQWCELAGVEATPTIYLNGFQMPLVYNLNDVGNLCAILKPRQNFNTPVRI